MGRRSRRLAVQHPGIGDLDGASGRHLCQEADRRAGSSQRPFRIPVRVSWHGLSPESRKTVSFGGAEGPEWWSLPPPRRRLAGWPGVVLGGAGGRGLPLPPPRGRRPPSACRVSRGFSLTCVALTPVSAAPLRPPVQSCHRSSCLTVCSSRHLPLPCALWLRQPHPRDVLCSHQELGFS